MPGTKTGHLQLVPANSRRRLFS